MNSFEFSTDMWNSYYAYQDEIEERKRNVPLVDANSP